jgi:colicin import membrane protein
MEEKALIIKEKLDVSVIFTEKGMSLLLTEIEKKAKDFEPDITTDSGRKEIASMAHKVARSKTLIDDVGKDSVAEQKKKVDDCNKYRKQARDFLDNLKDEVRKPLTEWEAEQDKIKKEEDAKFMLKIEARSKELVSFGKPMQFNDIAMLTDTEYKALLSETKTAYEAEQTRIAEEKIKMEADKAELERLRAEQLAAQEKIRLEQEAERLKLDAIRKEQEDAQRKIDAEKKGIEDAKRAEQERKDREAFEKKAAEQAKIQAEKDAAEKIRLAELKREQEAKEAQAKTEREAAEKIRQEALRPDKEKLIEWARTISLIMGPSVSDVNIKEIIKNAQTELFKIAKRIAKQAEEL